MNSPFRFGLRSHILCDGSTLRDSLTGTLYPLNELALKIVEAIEVPLTLGEILAKVACSHAIDRTKVERELRRMLLCGLLEGSCIAIRERLQRIRSGETLSTRVLDGSQFACQNSGACCRGYVFGPIGEAEKARIEELDPRKALPHLGTQPLFVESGVDSGGPTYNLATIGDSCVFLENGSHCGLHRAFGGGAKPALCQLYPLGVIATIDGLKVYDRGECATFAVSAHTGARLQSAIPRIRSLVHEDLYHPAVWIHRAWRCDYGLVLTLSGRLDSEARANPPLQALHTIGHIVRGFILTLAQCPFDSGQPETAVAAGLDRPAHEFRPSEAVIAANAVAGLHSLAALAEALVARVAPSEYLTPPFVEAASFLQEICHHLVSGRPLSDRAHAATSVEMEGQTEPALTWSLRQQLFGRDLLLDDHLPAGLLRMALVILLTLSGARLRALGQHRTTASPDHLSASHMAAKRTLHRPEPHALLRANGEQAWPILDALPWLSRELAGRGNPSVKPAPFPILTQSTGSTA